MINPDIIRPFRTKAEFFEETETLKEYFKSKRINRSPFFLNLEEFDTILKWKLKRKYHRQKYARSEKLTKEIVKKVTELALNISHPNKDYEIDLRINSLSIIWGVNTAVASAILALCFPEKFAVIDFRVWGQIFSTEKKSFSVGDYKKYLKEIQKLSEKLGWKPQEVDLAIWAYDEEKTSKKT